MYTIDINTVANLSETEIQRQKKRMLYAIDELEEASFIAIKLSACVCHLYGVIFEYFYGVTFE